MTRDLAPYLAPLCGAVLMAGTFAVHLDAQSAAARVHMDAARAAVDPPKANPNAPYLSFKTLYDQVCAETPLPDAMRANERSAAVVPFKEWYTWPVEIFDNFHFVGTKTVGVWAVSSPDGIILIDTSFHYSSKEAVQGLLNFGLDPNDIKYIIVTHAHDDRYWGAKALQDAYPNARVAMSAADWDVVAKDNSPAALKPRKDIVVTDGQKFTVGEVTVTAYVTPGHTPGTLSLLIEPLTNKKSVASDDERHVAALWGGTDASLGRRGVQYYPNGRAMMQATVESARRFIDVMTKAGVDVILSTSLDNANMVEKMRWWRLANPDHSTGAEMGNKLQGEAHPFVSKDAVARYNKIVLECYQAQLARRTGS